MPVKDGVLTLGGWITAPPIDEFERIVYEHGILFPFDWVAWADTAEGRTLRESPAALDEADLLTVRKYVTAAVRADRFCDGTMVALAEDGVLGRVARRLIALLES